MSRHHDALLLKRESLTLEGHPDDPDAVLAQVRAALDSGDPAMLDDAYAVLRRAMHRLLFGPGSPDAPPAKPGDRGAAGRADRTERRRAYRHAERDPS